MRDTRPSVSLFVILPAVFGREVIRYRVSWFPCLCFGLSGWVATLALDPLRVLGPSPALDPLRAMDPFGFCRIMPCG
jgi:hypothetical protein